MEMLPEPGYGKDCLHIYLSRKFDNTVPYTLEAYKIYSSARDREQYLAVLAVGAAGTAIVSGLVTSRIYQAAALIALISRIMPTIMSTCPPKPKGIGERCWLTEPIGLPMKANAGGEAGGFTALTLPTEGGVFHRKVAGGASLGARAALRPKPAGSCSRGGKILADPMGHERTGEAHH